MKTLNGVTSITLEDARRILEQGEYLMAELSSIDRSLAGFRGATGCLVQCIAFAKEPGSSSDYGRFSGSFVEMLPVPTDHAISALMRQRSKIAAQLMELGVAVPDAA